MESSWNEKSSWKALLEWSSMDKHRCSCCRKSLSRPRADEIRSLEETKEEMHV